MQQIILFSFLFFTLFRLFSNKSAAKVHLFGELTRLLFKIILNYGDFVVLIFLEHPRNTFGG